MPIRAVLFDLDNTLTHRDQSIQRYSELLLQQYQAYLVAPDLDKIQQIEPKKCMNMLEHKEIMQQR